MKTTQKRVWAILSALIMVFSVLGSVIALPVQAATVDYVYSGNYVYNWGQRETVATFLSPMAEEFYADNGVTYDELSAHSGASNTGDVPDSNMFDALHELMYGNLDNPTSYDATKNLFRYTDCQNSGGAISSFYSGESIGPSWNSSEWNREHCWPNSKSNGGSNSNTQRETDIMMLRPTSVSENSSRGNTAYGESSSFYHPNKEGGGNYDLRGDVSRIVLYVYVCWGGSNQHDGALDYMWGSSGVMESKAVLLKWMEEDPVDTWELGRNDAVESITGTRNVFVDYPELAFLLFNEDVPSDYDSPSGEGSGPAYTISASTNNSSYGTVSVSGKTITATPKTGYAVSGYTILSGDATVTRNGNVFTVVPTSDVSIRINFSKKTETTVQFVKMNGTDTQTAYVGDKITLPSGTDVNNYTFIGWSESAVSNTDTAPTYLKAGTDYTVSIDSILYALYTYSADGGPSNLNTFEQYSGTITEGDYILVYSNGAMVNEISSNRFKVTDVTVNNKKIENPAASIVWHVAQDGNYWTLYNESLSKYAAGNGTKNQGALLTAVTDYALWSVSGSSTYEFVNKGNAAKSINSNLRRNGTYGFACYSTSTGGALTLYKRVSGTLYYVTAQACDHTYDNVCDTTCNKCGAIRTVTHSYTSKVTTAATCGKPGVRTYTCSVCGDSYTEAIAATGNHTYDNNCDSTCNACGSERTVTHAYVSNVTKPATCGDSGERTYTCSVCGAGYTETIAATGEHTYSGDCDTYCDGCGDERTILAGGETTLSFSSTANRVSQTTSKQVWKSGDVTLTNNKGSSTSNVADYSNPVRLYASSEVIVECEGMTKIVFACSSSSYVSALSSSIKDGTVTTSGSTVTVTFAAPVNSLTIAKLSAQVRLSSITVTASGAKHQYDDDFDTDCNACGSIRLVAGIGIYSDTVSNSRMEMNTGLGGLAFKFEAFVSGAAKDAQFVGDLSNAVTYYGDARCRVIAMGAVMTNDANVGENLDAFVRENAPADKTVIDIPAHRLYEVKEDSCFFAVRITNIPSANHDTVIYARPYCIIECGGQVLTIYDDVVSATYSGN